MSSRPKAHPVRIDRLELGRDLAKSHCVEYSVLQAATRGGLNDKLGATSLHRVHVDRRHLARPHDSQRGGLLVAKDGAPSHETPQAKPVMGQKADLLDLTAGRREVGAWGDQEKGPDRSLLLQSVAPILRFQEEWMQLSRGGLGHGAV